MAELRPQGSDAWLIAEEYRRSFVDWAPWKRGVERGAGRLTERMLDLRELEDGWDQSRFDGDRGKRMVQMHQKLAEEIDEGSMVVVPRPAHGGVHLAPITGRFEFVDDPSWLEDYLRLREEQDLPVEPVHTHAGDVCQTWPTGDWTSVPFPIVPGWITSTLISRGQIFRIKDRPDVAQRAVGVVRRLYKDGDASRLLPDSNEGGYVSRLKARLQP